MNYLITGGAGFIGSHLSKALIDRGDRVTVIDDLSTGSIRNIEHLKSHPKFSYVIDSVTNVTLLAELVDAADQVFHLAAAVGVRLILESPVRTIETNFGCTELVMAAACKKSKKVFIASTSEVYGKSADVPFREDGDLVIGATTRGRWSYACSKALDEFLAIAYWKERWCPVVIARFFNTVGPRQTGRYGMVVPRFITQALRGDPITVYGDGSQRRCFAHVSDTVRGAIAVMDCDAAVGQVFNIGSSEETTIVELAERVRCVTGSESPIEFIPYEKAFGEDFEDMPRRVPALQKIRDLVGYEPQKRLDDVLSSVIEYHEEFEPVLA